MWHEFDWRVREETPRASRSTHAPLTCASLLHQTRSQSLSSSRSLEREKGKKRDPGKEFTATQVKTLSRIQFAPIKRKVGLLRSRIPSTLLCKNSSSSAH